MKFTILLLALLSTVYCVSIDGQTVQIAGMADIEKTTWGQIVLSMAEVGTESQGILADLLTAIENLLKELADNLIQLDQDYQRTQSTYETRRDELQRLNEDATLEISNAKDMINNVLKPMKANLEQKLNRLGQQINENRKALDVSTLSRQNSNQQFLDRHNTHQEAISAVDECIALLTGITNTGSLIEVSRLQNQVEIIKQKVSNKETLAPIITVIMQLMEKQNFADQSLVKDIIYQFNQLRKSLVDSINQDQADENKAVEQFKARVKALDDELAEFRRSATDATYRLATINTKLDTYSAFLDQRKSDLALIQEQQVELESRYAESTKIYTDLKTQYQNEREAAEKAYKLVSAPDFVNYIKSKGGL